MITHLIRRRHRSFIAGLALVCGAGGLLTACAREAPMTPELVEKWDGESLYSLTVDSLAGEPVDLGSYRGKVALVVNTASKCGLTPQYEGLQKLHETYKDRGLVVLGFPSNDFANQEPGTADEIRAFCDANYGVTFPMFAKVQTKEGDGQSPVYEFLGTKTGKLPGWNFGKYLVSKDGTVVEFFDSRTAPESEELRAAIDEALAVEG